MPSILLLGAAYGVVDEGLALQVLSARPCTAWRRAGRVFGANTYYLAVVIPLHAVRSVALPILLTELLFPKHRAEPRLGLFGLTGTVVYLLGVALVAVGDHTQLDPGYWAPPTLIPLSLAAAVVLGITALVIVPRTWRGRRTQLVHADDAVIHVALHGPCRSTR